MAWRRDESSSFISGSTIYAYTEVDWNVEAASCTYTHLGGVTSPYYWDTSATGTLFWREWSGGAWGAWNEYGSGTAHFGGYGDKELVRTDGFFARQAADREVQLACDVSAAGGTGSAWLTYTVPHLPNAPASITATRVSDNQVTVSWTAPTQSYDAMCLEVSIDGGSWSEFTQLWNASTSTTYSQASADHSYRFRARAYYQSAYSDYTSPTAAVAMTPSTPQSISVAASGGTNVAVTMTNNSPVATSLEYQTSTDGGSTWSASTTVSGSPVTSFSTSVSGTALIRVRNKNATGVSDWLVSNPITTICPPAPPTLRTPSGSVYDMALGDIEFSWLHNSLDGSTQTAYELRYAINGGAWTTLSGTTSQSRTVSLGTFSVGNAVTWQVRTKGADANYSDWSQTGAFNVYTAPTLSITSPSATITGMPIALTATYSDMAGFTCQAATVSLQKDGRTLFSEAATISGSSITASLTTDEFLPTNGESYTVVLTARSSSGLSTSANATFTVDFVEPQAGELSITNDPDTGYASLLATFDNSASEQTYTGSTNEQYESTEGYVRSLTVEGKSEKWNQFVDASSYTFSNNTYNGVTYDGNVNIGLQLSGTATGGGNTNVASFIRVNGHKYAILLSNETVVITDAQTWSTAAGSRIITANADGLVRLSHYRVTGASYNTTLFVAAIDLTAIFGSGNEPATVDAFKATDVYKAKAAAGELYAYDAGSLVSIEGVGVRGRNLAPFCEMAFNNIYNASTNPNGYWATGIAYQQGAAPTLSDGGWWHYSYDNSAGSGNVYPAFYESSAWRRSHGNLKPNTDYTLVIEFKNVTVSGTVTAQGFSQHSTSYPSMFPTVYSQVVANGNSTLYFNAMTVANIDDASILTSTRTLLIITAGASFVGDIRISLYEGTYTGAFEPYNDAGVFGENLLAPWVTTQTLLGVDWTLNADGSVTVNKTASGGNSQLGSPRFKLPAGTYTLTGGVAGDTGTTSFIRALAYTAQTGGTLMENCSDYNGTGSQITLADERWVTVLINVNNGVTVTNRTYKPQLIRGTVAKPYVPYNANYAPLRSAGSVHDKLMADADSWTVGRRVGAVDLGTLTWYASSAVSTIYHAQVPNMYAPTDALGRLDGILCANYAVDTIAAIDSRMGDKTMKRSGGEINIRDDSITTAAAFKTAMSGVYLFYELATPTQDTDTSMSTIEIGSAFTVATDLDSAFELTTWDGSADAVSISVSRVNADGTITPLITDSQSGAGFEDRYAPLNVTYQYAVTTKASSQAVKTVYVDNIIESDYWFAYWGDNVAKAKWNPDNGGIQVTRPQKTRVYYAGRRDPVSYDGHAVTLTETPSWMFIGKDEVDAFVKLIEDGGRGIYKSCDGWVYHADFDLTMTPSYTAIGYYGGASLGITRIAGDRL